MNDFLDEKAERKAPYELLSSAKSILNLGPFVILRCLTIGRRLPLALHACLQGGYAAIQGRQRNRYIGYHATLKSALTYFTIALLWAYVESEFSWQSLASAPLIGALIAPCLSPWIRLFPLTGDPLFSGWQRLCDLTLNALVHMTATALFVFSIKVCVTVCALPWMTELSWPSFFKATVGLVIANYLRRYLTEYWGTRWALERHPLGPELLLFELEKAHILPEQVRLAAWNDLRDLPGPGLLALLWKGWGPMPRGYRSLIDQSKLMDPVVAGCIDHLLH